MIILSSPPFVEDNSYENSVIIIISTVDIKHEEALFISVRSIVMNRQVSIR